MKQTKIVATIGPVTETKDTLRQMIQAGMNVARINFSHGEHSWYAGVINHIRELSHELDRPIAILADMQGPRIRTRVTHEITVQTGDKILIGDIHQEISRLQNVEKYFLLDQPNVLEDLKPGEALLVDEGAVQLRILGHRDGLVLAEAVNPGVIKNHKGVNLPDSSLQLPLINEKDAKDLAFAVEQGVDYIGLSFVSTAEDIKMVRDKISNFKFPTRLPDGQVSNPKSSVGDPEKGAWPHRGLFALGSSLRDYQLPITNYQTPHIVAKIERKEALKNLNAIIKEADAVMVARGDLGIETPESGITLLQKDIIARSLKAVKPVIVATQMLKSMVDHPRPTRAEVSDVSNAVIDHTDAVMLSEETAAGNYPVETVKMMAEIIEKTEASPFDDIYRTLDMHLRSEYAVMVRSVYELAHSFNAKAILLLSVSGFTARLMSHFRPTGQLLVATNNRAAWNRMALLWGVDATLFEGDTHLDQLIDRLMEHAKKNGQLHFGDKAIACLGRHDKSDMLQLVGVKDVM